MVNIRWVGVLATLLFAATADCSEAEAQGRELTSEERRAEGCYDLLVGIGLTPDVQAQIPDRISLLPNERELGTWLELIPSIVVDGREMKGMWRGEESGGIRIVWSDGHSGLLLRGRITAHGLEGTARTMQDIVGAPFLEGSFRAARLTPCPGPARGSPPGS